MKFILPMLLDDYGYKNNTKNVHLHVFAARKNLFDVNTHLTCASW